METVRLKRTKRLLSGHLWVFSNEIDGNLKKYAPGSIIQIYDMRNVYLGQGYINPNSLISIRLLTRRKVPVDRSFFAARIRSALDLRSRFPSSGNAVRLIYSEGDYLPGLIVDQYGKSLVVQLLTLGMENLKSVIVGLLDEMLSPDLIVLRNDSRIRNLEGLSLYKEVIKGRPDPLPQVTENGLVFEIDPIEGQKTGFFLDQKENRKAFAELAGRGEGLDLFSYSGAWAVALAKAGAVITSVDSSDRAVSAAERNAALNGVAGRIKCVKDDVFHFLDGAASHNEKYDFVVCDPPAFIKSADKLREGLRGYTELNAKCMKLVKEGGMLATSSCSYQLGKEIFLDMLRSAARSAGRACRIIALRSQGHDHPVLLSMPETEYLKCAFLVVE